MPPPSPSRQSPVGSIALLMIAVVVYIPMVMAIYGAPSGDPAQCGGECRIGLAWAELFALFFGALLWLALGGMLLLAALRGAMPAWAKPVDGILYLLSAVAAWAASEAYIAADGGWSVLVPALLPPLIASYALWVRLPVLAARVPPDLAARVALGATALVAISALPLGYYDQTQLAAHVTRDERQLDARIAAQQAELARLKEKEDAQFQTLSSDSPLADYVFFIRGLPDDDPRRQQVLEGVRHVKTRQADAAQMLDQGQIYRLVDLWRFDLEATPALCAAYDATLHKAADAGERYDLNVGEDLERQLPNIKFFVAGGCDLDVSLGAAAARVAKIIAVNKGDQHWEQLQATLLALRKTG